jgi:uncharacterized membrane protein HdeD (DUF308 family)
MSTEPAAPNEARREPRLLEGFTAALALVGGVVLIVWPGPTLLVFSQVTGWTMGAVGVLGAADAISSGRLATSSAVRSVGIGLLGIALILWPGETLLVVTVLAGAWLIVDGGSRVLGTLWEDSTRAELVGNLLGIAEALLGILVIARPISGVRAAAVFAGLGLVMHGLARTADLVTASPRRTTAAG